MITGSADRHPPYLHPTQDLRNSPSRILDLSSGSGLLSKVLGRLETTQEIRMMDMSGGCMGGGRWCM